MAVQYAAKVLGVEYRATYDLFTENMWHDALQAEHRASGFPGAIQRLNTLMLDSARINVLFSKAATVIGQLREVSSVYECVLLRSGLPSFDLFPIDENSCLRQRGSNTNTTPQQETTIGRARCPKRSCIHGVG